MPNFSHPSHHTPHSSPPPPLGEAWANWAKEQLQEKPSALSQADFLKSSHSHTGLPPNATYSGTFEVAALLHPCDRYLAQTWHTLPSSPANTHEHEIDETDLLREDVLQQLIAAQAWLIRPPSPYIHGVWPVSGVLEAFLLGLAGHATPQPVLLSIVLSEEAPLCRSVWDDGETQTLLWLCQLNEAWVWIKNPTTGEVQDMWVSASKSLHMQWDYRIENLLQRWIQLDELPEVYPANHPNCQGCRFQTTCHSP